LLPIIATAATAAAVAIVRAVSQLRQQTGPKTACSQRQLSWLFGYADFAGTRACWELLKANDITNVIWILSFCHTVLLLNITEIIKLNVPSGD
jgi:hypothetical protein